jgi:signal transduction histidine kinase
MFLLITLVPSGLLIWFGWRSLQQDRALALQQVQERREQTADLIVSGLEQNLTAAEQSLRDPSALQTLAQPEGAVAVIFTPTSVEAFPKGRLLFYPISPAEHEAPASLFAAAEELEFRRADSAGAAAALRTLAQSPDPAIRAGALIRLARNLRKNRHTTDALAVYSQAAGIRDAVVGGVPADLLARWARCDLLAQSNRTSELREEAGALSTDLLRSRWRLTRTTYEFHAQEISQWLGGASSIQPTAQALRLARTVEWLWTQWQSKPVREHRVIVDLDGAPMTILSNGDASHFVALAAGPEYRNRQWLDKLSPLLARQHVRVTFHDPGARFQAANLTRRLAAETGLPWTIAVESAATQDELAPVERRRTLWLAGLLVLASLVLVGSYVIAHAVMRELAVARLQSDFVSAVSHEFRTPLTSLRQLTEILSDGRIASEDRRQAYYQALARQTERLHRLVEGLLDFGRMESGTSPYRPQPLDGCAFVRAVVEEFEAEVSSRGYHVELAVNGTSATIAGDREALTNALWNLLDNAVKYSIECRTVWVSVEREARRLAICVRDRGLGIPAAEQKEIFRKFVRGMAAKSQNIKGTGIGLAMVQHVVTAHGGEIRVASEPGAGSTFTMLLPIEETCPAS